MSSVQGNFPTLQKIYLSEFILRNRVHLIMKSEIFKVYETIFHNLTNQLFGHEITIIQAEQSLPTPQEDFVIQLAQKVKSTIPIFTLGWPMHLLKLLVIETILFLFEMHVLQKSVNMHPYLLSNDCTCLNQRMVKFRKMEIAKKALKRITQVPSSNEETQELQESEISPILFYPSLYMFCLFCVQLYYTYNYSF